MKKLLIIILSLFVFSFQACKDDFVSVEKTFVEQGKTSSEIGFGGIILTLYPDGAAGILYAGDIVYRGIYKLKGDMIEVKEGNRTTKFKIISGTELRYESSRVLKLQNR